MKYWFTALSFFVLLAACKSKKKKNEEEKIIISALSIIQSQVKMVDTSSYTITRVQTADGISDTGLISKDEFRRHAREFLSLPDISTEKNKENYDVSKSYDTMLNNLVMVYTANSPEEEIRRETVLWEPDSTQNGRIRTIYVNRQQEEKDSFVEKELTWHINRRFQIITKTQIQGQPEKIKIVQVRWQ